MPQTPQSYAKVNSLRRAPNFHIYCHNFLHRKNCESHSLKKRTSVIPQGVPWRFYFPNNTVAFISSFEMVWILSFFLYFHLYFTESMFVLYHLISFLTEVFYKLTKKVMEFNILSQINSVGVKGVMVWPCGGVKGVWYCSGTLLIFVPIPENRSSGG